MIVYVDSSIVVRALLPDEADHERARRQVLESNDVMVTGSWTRVEVSSALTRAARAARGDADLLQRAASTLLREPYVVTVDAEQAEVELIAELIVKSHGIRSLDAWHLAVAHLVREELTEHGEEVRFATLDARQAEVAARLGFGAA